MDQNPTSRPRRRRLRIWRWLLAALFVAFGYGAWREYAHRSAIAEATRLGWMCEFDDPFERIRMDWTAAFRWQTWKGDKRRLHISVTTIAKVRADLIRRLAPREVFLTHIDGLADLSVLRETSGLELVSVNDCLGLTSLDGIEGQTGLRALLLANCLKVERLDAIKDLPAMEQLHLGNCIAVKNLDAVSRLSTLKVLMVMGCFGLDNADGIKSLSRLEQLNFSHCIALPNPPALDGLSSLRMLSIDQTGLKRLDGIGKLSTLREIVITGGGDSNLAALRGLTGLRRLNLHNFGALTSFDGLDGLPELEWMFVSDAENLTDIGGITSLPKLKDLNLIRCEKLKSLDAVKGVATLKILRVQQCKGIAKETVDATRAAMPNVSISFR